MKQIVSSKINALKFFEISLFMATHYATLKNGGIRTKILVSQQYLILDY